VVGPGPSDDLLASALRRSGGDLAAAVNIVLDTPPPARSFAGGAPANFLGRRAQQNSQANVVATVSLDDSDDEEETGNGNRVPASASTAPPPAAAPPAAAAKVTASKADLPAAQQRPRKWPRLEASGEAGAAKSIVKKEPTDQEATAAQREWKRPRVEAPVPAGGQCGFRAAGTSANPGTQRVRKEFMFRLGTAEIKAYSTIRLSAEQQFPSDAGMGPLLRAGSRLDLRWTSEVKTRKGRPGSSDASSNREGGIIRVDAGGKEVGKFPAFAARTLIPLKSRQLAEVEAFVGDDPPLGLDLGTTVPVKISISLRSTALRLPGQVGSNVEKAPPLGNAASSGSTGSATAKAKARGQKAVQKEEADREVLRTATAQLLELLRLPCRRTAEVQGGGEPGEAATSGAGSGGDGEGQADEDADEAEEMTREVAAQLGGREALERHDLPGVALPVSLFTAKLRWYQAQAVYWMWQTENPTSKLPEGWIDRGDSAAKVLPQGPLLAAANEDDEQLRPLHPMWDEYELPEPAESSGKDGAARFIYHHRTTGAVSLDFPDAALAHCRGGVLADDMGLGKTVMCLALLALDSAGPDVPSARNAAPELRCLEEDTVASQRHVSAFFKPGADDGVGGVLVVAPVSLISQWHAEIEKHIPPEHRPSVHEYHGPGRCKVAEQLRQFGVVLTTYGTLSAERQDAALFQVYWRRVILDEAHTIKNRCSRIAQAAFQLRSFCRWSVTGTPLQNHIDELYALVRFLRVDPWSSWAAWRKAVTLPLERGRHGDTKAFNEALDAARRIVQPLLLRRTKTTTDPRTGELLLKLPPKHVHVLQLDVSEAERDFYDALYRRAKATFDTFVSRGQALSMYTHILQLILKLRQALCHPFLVFARGAVQDQDMDSLEKQCIEKMVGEDGLSERYVEGVLNDLRTGDLPECAICCDKPEDPAMTPCGHIFCRECAIQALKKCNADCPLCQRKNALELRSLRVLPGASRFPAHLLAKASAPGKEAKQASDAAEVNGAMHSTKMKELLRLLRKDMAGCRRAVVFSQWTSFLDLIGSALEAAEIPFQRFDGSLSREARAERVAWLGEPAGPTAPHGGGRVLLCSLKAGGVGLNLVAATRLYLLDLWWNPAMEEQAIQRVHRIGQTQEVEVYKFVVRDSIDQDLLQLQRAKAHLLEDAIQHGGHREAAAKLTLDDLKRLFNPCRSIQNLRSGGASSAGGAEQAASSSSAPPPVQPQQLASASAVDVSGTSAVDVSGASGDIHSASAVDASGPSAVDVSGPSAVDVSSPRAVDVSSASALPQPPLSSRLSGFTSSSRGVRSASAVDVSGPAAVDVRCTSAVDVNGASAVDVGSASAVNVSVVSVTPAPASLASASLVAHEEGQAGVVLAPATAPATALAPVVAPILEPTPAAPGLDPVGEGAEGLESDLMDLIGMGSVTSRPEDDAMQLQQTMPHVPDWEAGGLHSPSRGCAGSQATQNSELSDSDLLAACDAFEESMALSSQLAPDPLEAAPGIGDTDSACWAAMSMEEDVL